METEKLEFKLTLCPKRLLIKNKSPEFKIAINDHVFIHSQALSVESCQDKTEVVFKAELPYCVNEFKLFFINKEPGDTIYENGNVIDDLYIHILKVEVDNMDITPLVKKLSVYNLNSPTIYNNIQCTKFLSHNFLSWNGVWSFQFDTPFYKWLIDQL